MPGIEALRLTAALVHTVPSVTALLTPDHGRDVVVGSDPRCHPDLSACQLRRLVADERRGSNPFTWLSAVRSIELGGPDVTVIDDDVLAQESLVGLLRAWGCFVVASDSLPGLQEEPRPARG